MPLAPRGVEVHTTLAADLLSEHSVCVLVGLPMPLDRPATAFHCARALLLLLHPAGSAPLGSESESESEPPGRWATYCFGAGPRMISLFVRVSPLPMDVLLGVSTAGPARARAFLAPLGSERREEARAARALLVAPPPLPPTCRAPNGRGLTQLPMLIAGTGCRRPRGPMRFDNPRRGPSRPSTSGGAFRAWAVRCARTRRSVLPCALSARGTCHSHHAPQQFDCMHAQPYVFRSIPISRRSAALFCGGPTAASSTEVDRAWQRDVPGLWAQDSSILHDSLGTPPGVLRFIRSVFRHIPLLNMFLEIDTLGFGHAAPRIDKGSNMYAYLHMHMHIYVQITRCAHVHTCAYLLFWICACIYT